jgi:arylsulfatase A-like enzyme
MPYLTQQQTDAPHEALFWKLAAYSAVRVGRWKLYLEPGNGIARLYDLEADPAEREDLAERHPQVLADLRARYDSWNGSLPPKAWTNISPVFRK